ncbi:MAG TPA: penicillin acylase family protein [Alphaproteobacteria bacterium]|nr:penicillin acylase family protein [Alphaproteobacteria bacterium]HAJ45780.1 penicillin acylase family protein [Alphaproteobacteria bacterium]
MARVLTVLKWLGLGLAALVVALAGIFAGVALYLRGSVPQLNDDVTVSGIGDTVRVTRDRYGIPHIEAESLADALFGLGFVHGQDRLWQLEVTRRLIQGRTAELAGSPAVIIDTYMRSLGLYRASQSAAAAMPAEERPLAEAYVAGINAARKAHKGPLPPEFTLADITPEDWTLTDSHAVVKSLALQLSANAFREGLRVLLLKNLSAEQLHQFAPPFPPEVAQVWAKTKAGAEVTAALSQFAGLQDRLDLRGASNNWVVSGNRSQSGKPILANDPHLGMSLPAIWYLARMTWPGGEAVGGTVPGIPGIVTGRTHAMAFGLTTTGADTQDLILEKVNPANGQEYLSADGPKPFRARTETIRVRFGNDQTIQIRETDYGPVLPAADPRVAEHVPAGMVLSLRWPALDAEDNTLTTSLRILTASDASEATMARVFAGYKAPIQSWVYAGLDGNIGKIVPGPIPLRAADNPSQGLMPAPGWDGRTAWPAQTAYAQWPHERNPADGWLATANNDITPKDYPHKIASEWDSAFRFRRIETLLGAEQKHSVASFQAMQLDNIDQYAREILPILIPRTKTVPGLSQPALELLRGWNGAMAMDRPEPLIFAAWMREFSRALLADEMGGTFPLLWSYWPDFVIRVLTDKDGSAAWCDDRQTPDKAETCGDILGASLDRALKDLRRNHGSQMLSWRWDSVHKARMTHIGFGQIPVLNWLFNFEVAVPGGAHTLNRADHRFASANPFAAVHGTGFRGISDMGAPDKSLYMIATGQSGNVYSPHYRDLTPLWADGQYLTIGATPSRLADTGVSVLNLIPPPQALAGANSR